MRHVTAHGCLILREGGNHTVVVNPANRRQSSVPRHNEIGRFTARAICRQLEIPTID
jgi:mRNA interferase HicA